jgi:hypothetical protein
VRIFGMFSFVFGVVLLPVSGVVGSGVARWAFGLGTLLFIGQALGLAGHYQLYNRTKNRHWVWFPLQEKIVVGITVLISFLYSLVFIAR